LNIDRTSAAQPSRIPTPIHTQSADAPSTAPAMPDDATRRDRIDLSRAARGLSQQSDAAREARIRELQAQVEAGTYQVDPTSLAEQVMKSGDL